MLRHVKLVSALKGVCKQVKQIHTPTHPRNWRMCAAQSSADVAWHELNCEMNCRALMLWLDW
jgi:hypothetical protein